LVSKYQYISFLKTYELNIVRQNVIRSYYLFFLLKTTFCYEYTHALYSLNESNVALISIKASLPSIVSSNISYGRNKEYNRVVISTFDREK
jgi:hypothetical protein